MKNSKIEWCDNTFNPWIGCTRVSPGCAHCYAEELMATRYGKVEWGKGSPRLLTSDKYWQQPLRWNRAHADAVKVAVEAGEIPPRRPRVFCASLSDWLDDEVPIEWLRDLLVLIHETPHLDWLLLTKRAHLFQTRINAAKVACGRTPPWDATSKMLNDWAGAFGSGEPPANVWIGTSIEDQPRADERIPQLLTIPAHIRFLSCEPLLGPVDFLASIADSPATIAGEPVSKWLQWTICGGESGHHARPMYPEWARSLRDQCQDTGVAFFFKQWGEWAPGSPGETPNVLTFTGTGSEWLMRCGKKIAGRLLDGVEHNAFPQLHTAGLVTEGHS